MEQFEIEDLPSLGPIQITEIGEENIYFTLADGRVGFVKSPMPRVRVRKLDNGLIEASIGGPYICDNFRF